MHQEKEDMIDAFEDLVLGHLAKERYKSTKKDDFLDIEELI